MPGNPSLGLFTLPRWDRTYLGVFQSLTRTGRGHPAPRAPGCPHGMQLPDPSGAPLAVSPRPLFRPFTAGQGQALPHVRRGSGWVGSPRWELPRGTPRTASGLGAALSDPPPALGSLPILAPLQHGSGLGHRETQKEHKQEWGGGEVFKSTKNKKKSPPP